MFRRRVFAERKKNPEGAPFEPAVGSGGDLRFWNHKHESRLASCSDGLATFPMPTETAKSIAQEQASLEAHNSFHGGAGFTWAYLAFLFCAQAGYAWLYVHSAFLRTTFVVPTAFRLGTWTLPVLIYLIVTKQNLFDFLKLRNVWRGIVWGVAIGLSLVLLNLIGAYGLRGHVRVDLHLPLNHWLGAVLMVGLSEEVVFRGFLLSAFAARSRFRIANLLQAVLFLAIHLPGWALMHQFVWPSIMQQIVYIFALGAMLGFVRKKSDSLWACMLIHSFNNFAALAIK